MDNVNDIIDMLKDRLVEATRKTNRIDADIYGDNALHYTFAELYEAIELEEQLRGILCTITGSELIWSEGDQVFIKR